MRALSEALLWIETTTITGEIIHITNSTPYARRIEFGYYSIQKPEGMLRVAYRRVVQWIRQKVL